MSATEETPTRATKDKRRESTPAPTTNTRATPRAHGEEGSSEGGNVGGGVGGGGGHGGSSPTDAAKKVKIFHYFGGSGPTVQAASKTSTAAKTGASAGSGRGGGSGRSRSGAAAYEGTSTRPCFGER